MRINYREFNKKAYLTSGGHQFSMEFYYDSPDMYYRLVEMGTRIKNKQELVKQCYLQLQAINKKSPDYGACLCVIGYNDKNINVGWLKQEVEEYIEQELDNPHFIRWQISLCYLLFTLTDDYGWLAKCLEYDFTKFSPMILTKQLRACELLYFKTNNTQYLNQGLSLYKKALESEPKSIVGDGDFYTRISIREFCQISEIASRLAELYQEKEQLDYSLEEETIHIIFNIDEAYTKQCEVVIKSILANTTSPCKFHIIGVDSFQIEADCIFYPKPDLSMFTGLKRINHISTAMIYRVLAPFIVEVDKALYLDCDIIVRHNIAELFEIDVDYIGGVKDGNYIRQANKNNLSSIYINSGILIMNLKALRDMEDYIKRLEDVVNGGYNLSLYDQDLINIAFQNEIELLPAKWNVFAKIYNEKYTNQDLIERHEVRANPAIIHWCGHKKPWNSKDVWMREEWFKYYKREG